MIIKKCNKAGKITIVATQMLESMINSPVATRAEVSDIANSVFDGADAIMLSEETSLGEFPVEAVKVMTKVLENSEKSFPHKEVIRKEMQKLVKTVEEEKDVIGTTETIAFSSIVMARETKAKAIVALTDSGDAVRGITRFRPKRPIIVMSSNKETMNQLVLSYGCIPTKINSYKYVGQALDSVRKYVLKNKIAKKGESVIVVSNMPPKNEELNMVTVLKI
jgi:pyruvate kinase